MQKRKEVRSRSKRILVTGGAGFIGSHLVDSLISKGSKVKVLDNMSYGKLENIEHHLNTGNAQLVKGDVRNKSDVEEALADADTVFHLAAIVSVPYSVENPTITNQVNALGTRNLLKISSDNMVRRFIYVSTCAVYGDPQYLPIDEEHPLNPLSPYAESKLSGEQYCTRFLKQYNLKTVILRLFNVYGPRQSDNEYSGVITRFIDRIRSGKPPIIFGDGKQTRDFVHVNDVVQALLLSISTNDAIGQTLNIGSGNSVTIDELSQLVLREFKAEPKVVHEKPRLGEIKHSCARIQRAQVLLGYKPEVTLESGIQDLCASMDVVV